MKESSTWITDSSGDRINCLTAQGRLNTQLVSHSRKVELSSKFVKKAPNCMSTLKKWYDFNE